MGIFISNKEIVLLNKYVVIVSIGFTLYHSKSRLVQLSRMVEEGSGGSPLILLRRNKIYDALGKHLYD